MRRQVGLRGGPLFPQSGLDRRHTLRQAYGIGRTHGDHPNGTLGGRPADLFGRLSVTGIEEAQRTPPRPWPPFEHGLHAGQRMAPLIEGAQHVSGVPKVPVADETPFGLLVRVQRPLVVSEETGIVLVVPRREGVPGEHLAERRDLRIDAGKPRLPPASPQETGDRSHYPVSHAGDCNRSVGLGPRLRRGAHRVFSPWGCPHPLSGGFLHGHTPLAHDSMILGRAH